MILLETNLVNYFFLLTIVTGVGAGEYYVVTKVPRGTLEKSSISLHDIKSIMGFKQSSYENYLVYLKNDDYIIAHYQHGPTKVARIGCTYYIRQSDSYAQVSLDPFLFFWFKAMRSRL